MKASLLAFLFFSIGILLYVILFDSSTKIEFKEEFAINPEDLKSISTGITFIDIFLNNLIVGLMLSYLGFFTGGVLTAVLLILNGFFVSTIYGYGLNFMPFEDILYYSKHVPIEPIALFLFSKIGFSGYGFMKNILSGKEMDMDLLPRVRELMIPSLLLFLASIIEVI
jgi:uncharacterized membrane protein SpoIIM required for sporulation